MHNKKDMDYAYMAGVIDSDGSISISRTHPKRKNPHYKVSIQLSWSSNEKTEKAFNEFVSKYGGKWHKTNRHKNAFPSNNKIVYKWGLCQNELCYKFLEGILPHLRLKKEQAEIAMEFLNNKLKYPRQYGFGRPKPKEFIEYELNTWLKMKELNTKNKGVFYVSN